MQRQSVGVINDIFNAKPLLILGDSITTDHISPAGDIAKNSPAAEFLQSHGVEKADFNSYGARRGSHSVMMRGTFANIRIKNEMLAGVEGGYTKNSDGKTVSVYEGAMENKKAKIPSVVIAGKEYGTGSSRDWAAKGSYLLGVKAVIAESFERIHRSNLVGMGVLPFEFTNGENRISLGLKGDETITIANLKDVKPMQEVDAEIKRQDSTTKTVKLRIRIDTNAELEYIKNGGIMQYVIRNTVFKNGEECGNSCSQNQCCCPITCVIDRIIKFFKKLCPLSCKKNACNKSSCEK